MAGYDKYHDELVMVPKGSVARGSGDVKPMRSTVLTKAEKAARDAANKEVQKKLGKMKEQHAFDALRSPADDLSDRYRNWGGRAERSSFRDSESEYQGLPIEDYKKGGRVKKMAKGGSVKSSASKRADGCAQRGKTKGRMV